jgi:hypothetical protein
MSRVHRYPSGRPEVEDPMLWAEQGACKGQPIAVFFPLPGKRNSSDIPKALCATCEVQVDCLAYALRTDQPDGIWGGMTADERQALAAPVGRLQPISHGTQSGYKTHRRRGEMPCEDCLRANARTHREWMEKRR